jgi:hypothetical protein
MSDPRSVTLCGQQLREPAHLCAFFDSQAEQYEILAPYYQEGIEQGEQVITIVDQAQVKDHEARMAEHGISVEEALASGRLKVFTAQDTYTMGGSFAAERMYDMLQGALATAQREGWRVRTSGVMDWTYDEYPGIEELMAYEARVNVLLPIYDCILLCVYDLDRLDARRLMDVLTTHPFVIHRRQILKNPYYRPPVELLADLLGAPRPVGEERRPIQA